MNAGRVPKPLTVFYDGHCPICRVEVRYYQRIDRLSLVNWTDISTLAEDDLPNGKSRGQLLGIFHARFSNGDWAIGVDAFEAIWSRLPVLRRFAWLFRVPVLRQAAHLFYRGFLIWQKRDRARREKKTMGEIDAARH